MSDTIFNNEKEAPSQEASPSPSNDFSDQLELIKNDKGERKYGTVEQALEALKHSQEFIPELKKEKEDLSGELEALRKQQEKIDSLTEIVSKLTAKEEPVVHQPQEAPQEQDVAQLVQEVLERNKATETQTSNTTAVATALGEMYGTKAEETFYGKATELGLSKEAINQLAATSPKAVLALFSKQSTPSLTKGTQGVDHNYVKPQEEGRLKASPSSIMAGASTGDLMAEMARHKAAIYAKHNIQ